MRAKRPGANRIWGETTWIKQVGERNAQLYFSNSIDSFKYVNFLCKYLSFFLQAPWLWSGMNKFIKHTFQPDFYMSQHNGLLLIIKFAPLNFFLLSIKITSEDSIADPFWLQLVLFLYLFKFLPYRLCMWIFFGHKIES